ncbi:carbohydrate sulfotransferase 1-like [Plakobranchus ocellatus]|uniref:Carbohydrate sulfotransferase 1-like n=1 Tax=Plakobranchus ocellatus TaxID=259542 RepID=A0AAV4CZB6_9GAST|nr:carbohydrate sulfotransferase 1-like [Plakobranchus ocellatus]
MQEMDSLLNSDPSVKVIHLLRDPRACLRSRNLVGTFKLSHVQEAAAALCNRTWENLQMLNVLHFYFPDRILNVRYEDLVASPIEASRQIYNFVGLTFTPDVERFVWTSMYGGLPDDCNICSTRSNATTTAYKWRSEIKKFPQILLAQKKCAAVMNTLGYRSFNTSLEMLSKDVSSTLQDYGDPNWLKVDVQKQKQENFKSKNQNTLSDISKVK